MSTATETKQSSVQQYYAFLREVAETVGVPLSMDFRTFVKGLPKSFRNDLKTAFECDTLGHGVKLYSKRLKNLYTRYTQRAKGSDAIVRIPAKDRIVHHLFSNSRVRPLVEKAMEAASLLRKPVDIDALVTVHRATKQMGHERMKNSIDALARLGY